MINGKYSRIVAYGCSFTAGDELADADVLGIPEEEVDLLKRSGISRKELYGSLREETIKRGKQLTWVRWVADHFGVRYSNRAEPGGSIDQMLYRIERDYYNGEIAEEDLVIVGLTSMFRWFQFDKHGYEFTWVVTSPPPRFSELNDKLLENYVNDYNILWNYYMKLNYIQKLCFERKNIKMLHAIKPFSREKGFIEGIPLNKQFEKLISSFKYPDVLLEHGIGDLCAHLPMEECTHGWGHPKVQFQKEYAKLIIDKLETMDD